MMRAMGRAIRAGLALGAASTVLCAPVAFADSDLTPAPTLSNLLGSWSGDVVPWIGIIVGSAAYLAAVRVVDRRQPQAPVPRWRVAAWLAGLAVIALALVSPVDTYATSLFSVHMVQHVLLAMVAPPLLALGAPITLLLRVTTPRARRRFILPFLNSRLIRAISWPPAGWVVFAVVMWVTHFSPLFEAALEDEGVHILEHGLYLTAGAMFWWPAVGADPSPRRLRPGARIAYLALQMPLNTAVGLAIYFAPTVLYAHYASLQRAWGPHPYADQQVAGIVMWAAGDVILLAAVVLAASAWLRADEQRSRRLEKRAVRRDDRATAETG